MGHVKSDVCLLSKWTYQVQMDVYGVPGKGLGQECEVGVNDKVTIWIPLIATVRMTSLRV